jgi:hypothetical protein
MQGGPADGERKPLSHLVTGSSKPTNCPRVIERDALSHACPWPSEDCFRISANLYLTGLREGLPVTRPVPDCQFRR